MSHNPAPRQQFKLNQLLGFRLCIFPLSILSWMVVWGLEHGFNFNIHVYFQDPICDLEASKPFLSPGSVVWRSSPAATVPEKKSWFGPVEMQITLAYRWLAGWLAVELASILTRLTWMLFSHFILFVQLAIILCLLFSTLSLGPIRAIYFMAAPFSFMFVTLTFKYCLQTERERKRKGMGMGVVGVLVSPNKPIYPLTAGWKWKRLAASGDCYGSLPQPPGLYIE